MPRHYRSSSQTAPPRARPSIPTMRQRTREYSFDHESVRHSVGEYVRGMAHTNGIESFWSMLKRAHKGVYHHFSVKHLQRYVDEFAGRHGVRGT